MKVSYERLVELLADWNDPLGARTMSDAEDLILELQIEIGGKEGLINTLQDDLKYFKDAHAERARRGF